MVRLTLPLGWLPAERPVRRFLGVSFIDSLGTGLFLAGSALFFTRDLGLSAEQVGLGLSLGALAGLVCSVPIGRLSDAVDPRRALVALQLWRGACFFGYVFVRGFPFFIVVACLVGVGEWGAPPVVQSLVGSLVQETSKVRSMAAVMLVRNVGFSLGAALAAGVVVLSGTAYRGLVLADAVSFLVSAALVLRLPSLPAAHRDAGERVGPRWIWPGGRFAALAALNGVLSLNSVILTIGLPLWIATRTDGPGPLIGAVVLTNTVLAALLQLRLSRGVDHVRSGARSQFLAGVALAVCCLLVALTGPRRPAETVIVILVAAVALTLGELLQSIGGWAISYELSPADRRGYFLSAYGLGGTAMAVVGPWLISSAVLPEGPAGWVALAGSLALAGALVTIVARPER